MSATKTALISFCVLCLLSVSSYAQLKDQGLQSILQIIDKAIVDINLDKEDENYDVSVVENAAAALATLSRTLGTLSYSRLQCGQADVLAEFTRRVQKIPKENQNQVRDAFQEGFDKSREETALLSDDECERLTESRTRGDDVVEDNVSVDDEAKPAAAEEVVEEADEDEPRLRQLRIAELSGQLAYKTMICNGKAVFTRDYNAFMDTVPEEFQQEVKDTYWKGYKHGRRLNPDLKLENC